MTKYTKNKRLGQPIFCYHCHMIPVINSDNAPNKCFSKEKTIPTVPEYAAEMTDFTDISLEILRAKPSDHQNISEKTTSTDRQNEHIPSDKVRQHELHIREYLLSTGFKPNKLGYRLLSELLKIGLDGNKIEPLTEYGYPFLAGLFSKTVFAVEKNIQNAIAEAWLRGDINELYKHFGETIDTERGKPTNKQFILTSLEYLKNLY
ncbi:MAG: sporulation initiation factor Spo0A C-terminal domain-containing protein [Clostridiaceae bacterium]|jgi:hypothetical protein|nr:sporulation initiation factor Spo0A C-terminal domain-containing protein [Clostridiaceae bacterium]